MQCYTMRCRSSAPLRRLILTAVRNGATWAEINDVIEKAHEQRIIGAKAGAERRCASIFLSRTFTFAKKQHNSEFLDKAVHASDNQKKEQF